MWFMFPQLRALGRSAMARHYGLNGIGEAGAYLLNRTLGPRLRECTAAMLDWAGKRSAVAILGEIDAMKFRSSMTLFAAAGEEPEFGAALAEFYGGEPDPLTFDLLRTG